MSPSLIIAIVVAVLSLAGAGTVYYLWQKDKKSVTKKSQQELEDAAKKMLGNKLQQAERDAEELRVKAKRMYNQVRDQFDQQERSISRKLHTLRQEQQSLDDRQSQLNALEKKLKTLQDEAQAKRDELIEKINKTANLTKEEARKLVIKETEEEMKEYIAREIKETESQIKEKQEELSKSILIEAMQSVITDYVDETTVASVKLPNEDVKGRIIGKEGRNVRSFEKLTGVDVIIDDAPLTIGLSSFDAVRREIARQALENLIKDGRIHPGTIEYHVTKAKQNTMTQLKKDGQALAAEADWHDAPEEILLLLGRYKFRYSYGQSLYKHTLEVMKLAEYIAQSVGADVAVVKKAALLHDLGKVIPSKTKKKHHHVSGEIARKYGIDKKIVNAIEAHHGDIEAESVEAEIVKLADGISGARPGARKENYGDYVERLETLEDKVYQVVGDKAEEIYALRAGRELRVIVKPDRVDDNEAVVLARKIAKEIESSGVFPGSVQVIVIREVRASAETH